MSNTKKDNNDVQLNDDAADVASTAKPGVFGRGWMAG
jgi:hypothetical protein